MELDKKRVIQFSLAIIVILIIIFYFGYKNTCTTEECFNDAVKTCSPIKYDKLVTNNIYKYSISRSIGSNCNIQVSLEKLSVGTDFNTKIKLEGKSMKCVIPKSDLEYLSINQVEDLLSYCTGSLKEGIYELIIKKMYSIIISNLGEVLGDVQTSIIKKI